MSNAWLNAKPQYWDQQVPQSGDYTTAQDYIDALLAGSQDTSPNVGDGWQNPNNDPKHDYQTTREFAINKMNPANYADDPYGTMGLQNWVKNHPEEALAGYHAYDEMGNPLLDPSMLAIIEQVLGKDALGLPTAPAAGQGNWSQDRLGTWDESFLKELQHNLGDGNASMYDASMTDNMGRLMEGTDSNTAEYQKHISQVLADNGFVLNPDGSISQASSVPQPTPEVGGQQGNNGQQGIASAGPDFQMGNFNTTAAPQQQAQADPLAQFAGQNQSTQNPLYPDFIFGNTAANRKNMRFGGGNPGPMPRGY